MSNDNRPLRRALFAGSFNPFTRGHADIVERALCVFDEVLIGVGVSATKPAADIEQRVEQIARIYKGDKRVDVASFTGLTCEFARTAGCCALLRGVRNVTDFEYERNMADVNFNLSGIETVILMTRPELAHISSSIVRELRSYGVDVSEMLPNPPAK